MLSFPVETDFTPIRRYESFEKQHHAVVARGQASDSSHDRGGSRYRERRQQAPHDEAVISARAIEHRQEAASEQEAHASGAPVTPGLLGWLAKRLETMSES